MNPGDVAQSVLPLTSSDLSLITLFLHAHWLVKCVMIGLLIASVWVGALADDEEAVFANTRDATIAALKLGAGGGPWHGHLTEVDAPENPNFRTRNHSEDRENRPG